MLYHLLFKLFDYNFKILSENSHIVLYADIMGIQFHKIPHHIKLSTVEFF